MLLSIVKNYHNLHESLSISYNFFCVFATYFYAILLGFWRFFTALFLSFLSIDLFRSLYAKHNKICDFLDENSRLSPQDRKRQSYIPHHYNTDGTLMQYILIK